MMWNGNRKKIRLFRNVIIMVMVFSMLMTGPLRDYSSIVAEAVEEAKTRYISEIRLFYAPESKEQAVQKCKDSGFIPADGDLNAGTGKNHVVMGYKETKDKEDAICSIRLLSMNAGFEMKDYDEIEAEYINSNSATIDTLEAAALEFESNYAAGSPKAQQAYKGLNLINVPEADKNLGDYIVDGDADWDFYAKVVARSSSGTISAILGYLTTGMAAYKNEYDTKKKEKVSTSWAASVVDSSVWEDLAEASTEDEFDAMYQEYGDDAKAFHKKLQEFATIYENASATFDEEEYASELEKLKGDSDEEVVEDKEKLSKNEQAILYMTIYEELDQYEADGNDTLAEYLLALGNQSSAEVDLTKLYPVIDSMSYGERRMAGMAGLPALIQTAGENEKDEQVDEKIEEAADHIEDVIGEESYSIWMNKNQELKGKKVAYTSDAIRMDAAQQLIDNQDNTKWEDTANEVMKWVNMALGIVSCLLTIAKFTAIAKVLALIPAAICAIASACGLASAATSIAAIAAKISAFAGTAMGPVGWVTLAVMIVATLVIWLVTWILKLKKENSDYDYDDAPEYVADRTEGEEGDYLSYYKGAGSDDAGDGTVSDEERMLEINSNNEYHGEAGISDVNGRRGFRGWNCIFYSKDVDTGSPIVVKDDKAPFKIVYGSANPINGYDNVKPFGEIMPGNCNSLMKKDEVGGIYIHYRTEKSIQNAGSGADGESQTETDQSNLYYKDIIIRSADTEKLAKAKITAKGYKLWDVNLANNARFKYSRYEEWAYTYMGFKTTKSPKQAIRDIRVATYTPESAKEVNFGEVKYACAGNLGYKAENKDEDKEYPDDLDGLWFTTDEKAGTPIGVGKIHAVADHGGGKYVKDGWVPVTTFSGVPYNFASTRDTDTKSWIPGRLGNYGYSYTCYGTNKDNKWEIESRYLYYEPEVKYTSGTKYLSALFFTFGTDSESTSSKLGETVADFSQLVERMEKTPNTDVLEGNNLAKSFYYKGFVVESNQKYLHLGYSWSYNPYRALTDIRAYQTTIFPNNLPYTITKPSVSGKSIAYDSVTVVTQRTGRDHGWVLRGIGPENAYMFPTGLLGTNPQVQEGYTSYEPGGYKYSRKNMPFIATGLYVSGPVDGMEKLTLDDVVITKGKHKAKNEGGVISADVSGEKTLAGGEAGGEFNSVQEMKAPHETEPFNIAYPEWTNDDGDHYDAGDPCYIYIRKTAIKRKYISKIFVGSSSFDDTGMDEDSDIQLEVGKQLDANALNQANGATPDEVIPVNVGLVKGRAWYDIRLGGDESRNGFTDTWGGYYDQMPAYKEDRLPWLLPEFEYVASGGHIEGAYKKQYLDRAASYLSVERTDDPNEAIRGILLFKSDAKTVAERIQVGGVEYYCASVSNPIQMRKLAEGDEDDPEEFRYNWKKEKYFVYYTTNKGVSPGQPITDLDADENVLISKQATVLSTDKKDKVETGKDGRKSTVEKATIFGEDDLAMFIHAAYEKDSNMMFNKIYIGSGTTEKKALLALLEQGCTEFCDLNLNEGTALTKEDIKADKKKTGGEYVYFGYRGYALDEQAIKSKSTASAKEKEKDEQLQDAVYDIVCTVGEPYHSGGFTTEKNQIYYAPVASKDDAKGTNLNVGVQGQPIYMYYTTPWLVKKYNEKAGTDSRKNLSPQPKDYLGSPLTRICFTQYDRVPYNKESGVDSAFGDDVRAWEYILYADNKTPADMNDGALKFDDDYNTENNRICMFAQREDGNIKEGAEITGGYVSETAQVGEMWLNQ